MLMGVAQTDVRLRQNGSVARGSADRESITEVIVNLLMNAITYTPSHGTVTVRTDADRDSIHLEVSDTGIGIPEGERRRVFEEFYRASHAGTMAPDGMGLGLSLARQVVELHGGSIAVLDTEGAGARFHIVLPRAAAERIAEPALVAAPHHVGVQ